MNPSITLSAPERNTLLDWMRHHPDPALRLRCHIVLLLADGRSWATIADVLYCSTRTIDRWRARFLHHRLDGLDGELPGRRPRFAAAWAALVVSWVLSRTPRDFGLLRSRWSCACVAVVLQHEHQMRVSRETVRRWLRHADLVWRRPRPVVKKPDPQREAKVKALRTLIRELPEDETVVFEDEVDLNLNPKIGKAWMRRGQQAQVETPGTNQKKYRAGSLHWRTGKLLATVGPRRNGALFVRHLEDLRHRLRRYRVIHVLCDNARFHDSGEVQTWLAAHRGRIALHFLPKAAPECNPVERVWWHLHEEITRNHCCATLQALLELVLAWLEERKTFTVEEGVYADLEAA